MANEAGKGSSRRKENTPKIEDNLDKIDWSKRDKSKDSFKVRINGKLVDNTKQ